MEPLDFSVRMRQIARKHGIDINKMDFKKINSEREERMNREAIRLTKRNKISKKRRFLDYSVASDESDIKHTFDDFSVGDELQRAELDKAKQIAERISNGETGNFTFSGNAGSGKTLLAVSILNYVNTNSYNKLCYFLSFEVYMMMVKASFNDSRLKSDVQMIEMCVRDSDLLVLDDLGSETFMQHVDDKKKNPTQASEFTQELLYRFADYRKNKTNIVTTNNTSKELQSIYNPKIYSRLIAKKANNAIRFDSRDMRNI